MVEGVRVPDDETDVIIHRGGRYINNMYVPGEVVVTAEMSPSFDVSNRDEHVRSARSYQSSGDVSQNFKKILKKELLMSVAGVL